MFISGITFYPKYLGCTEVTEHTGERVTAQAIRKIIAMVSTLWGLEVQIGNRVHRRVVTAIAIRKIIAMVNTSWGHEVQIGQRVHRRGSLLKLLERLLLW